MVCGSGSCRVRSLKPFPERRTVVTSSGDVTSSRTDGRGSEQRMREEEKGRCLLIGFEVRRRGSVLER